jgi:hypothetical protein
VKDGGDAVVPTGDGACAAKEEMEQEARTK